jgi:hypothetical protein
MATRTVTVNDMLVGHVGLDVECLDRVYLNLYVPNVQVPGQVVLFLRRLGFPIPSPAVVEKIGAGSAPTWAGSVRSTGCRWSGSPRGTARSR